MDQVRRERAVTCRRRPVRRALRSRRRRLAGASADPRLGRSDRRAARRRPSSAVRHQQLVRRESRCRRRRCSSDRHSCRRRRADLGECRRAADRTAASGCWCAAAREWSRRSSVAAPWWSTTTRSTPTSSSSASTARSTTRRCSTPAAAVRNGARLIGTNDDATYPTPDGPIPGGGAILASIVTASGVAPIVAGKPHEPMAALGARHHRRRGGATTR